MVTLHEQGLTDLARASSATGQIIEAHSDDNDRICRVVIEMSDSLLNPQLREATMQLWMADGFIASISRDGHFLMIDGIIGQDNAATMDLINIVAQQMNAYTKQSMRKDSRREATAELAFLASALDTGREQPFA